MTHINVLVSDTEQETFSVTKGALHPEDFHLLNYPPEHLFVSTVSEIAPDILLLGLSETKIDELDIIRNLQEHPKTRHLPIIALSSTTDSAMAVLCFEIGVYDYMVKPVNGEVLAAKVKAIFRRNSFLHRPERNILTLGRLSIDPFRHQVTIDNSNVHLTSSEFDLLYFLARQEGKVFTRSQIIDRLHGPGYGVTARSIDVQLVGLREKLGLFAKCLETVRGIGYRFAEEWAAGSSRV